MSEPHPFTAEDHRQMERLGVAPDQARRHLELLRNPPPFTRVLRPCGAGDGILEVAPDQERALAARFDAAAGGGRIHKLVPASGAASRMFKPLQSYLDQLVRDGHAPGTPGASAGHRGGAAAPPPAAPSADARTFFGALPQMPFFAELARAAATLGIRLAPGRTSLADLSASEQVMVLSCLLAAPGPACPHGLGMSERPKGLIPFHRYREGERTPFEEHLVEAAETTRDSDGVCRVHLTVSHHHEAGFRAVLNGRGAALANRLRCSFQVELSHQSRSTDTLAVDPDHRPFRLADGSLLFRPGGHGALLDNLQRLAAAGAGIVLLKNIDNVVTDRGLPLVTRWKKLLGGLLLATEERVFALLSQLDGGTPDRQAIAAAAGFVQEDLSRPLPAAFAAASAGEQCRLLIQALDRPLRVAGVVRNSGEPGGGPFWVESAAGQVSLQIVEASQISPDPEQQAVLAASTHFNPVDIACAVHDRHGRAHDLDRFVDRDTVFISQRSHEGRPLKALEHPGLWNGAMAGWNTIFVEVPNATFAPVKTVLDLLRPEHQTEDMEAPL